MTKVNHFYNGWLDSGWKVPVKLTCKQEKYAWQATGVARFAFNLAVQTHAFHRTNRMKWPFVSDIQKAFNACKREDYPFVLEVSKFVAQGGFRDFERALKNWRSKEHPAGRPTLRRRKDGNGSFLAGAGVDVLAKREGKRITLPIMGSVKLKASLPAGYIPHEARIVRENGRWYLSLLGYRQPPIAAETQAVAGVDVGINPLAAVYSGGAEADAETVENPKAYYDVERKLRRWQRAQSRRTKGSRGWQEAQRRIDKLNRRIKGLRDNAQHQLSAHLAKHYGYIGIESLKIKGLFQNRHLAKALGDSALGSLLSRIRYKAEWYGRELIAADTFYPSSKTCFDCGAVNAGLTLKEKTWACPECGVVHDRDKNAARNLHKRALRAGRPDVTLPDGKALAAGLPIGRNGGETSPVEGRTRPNCQLAFAN